MILRVFEDWIVGDRPRSLEPLQRIIRISALRRQIAELLNEFDNFRIEIRNAIGKRLLIANKAFAVNQTIFR
jgi:hypothetical protein